MTHPLHLSKSLISGRAGAIEVASYLRGETTLRASICSPLSRITPVVRRPSVTICLTPASECDWIALDPVIGRSNGIGIARRAPRPHAALLFCDYLVTEAQPLLGGLDYVPINASVASPLGNLQVKIIDAATALDQNDRWGKAFNDTFIKRGS